MLLQAFTAEEFRPNRFFEFRRNQGLGTDVA
jgi:hypothetical protein